MYLIELISNVIKYWYRIELTRNILDELISGIDWINLLNVNWMIRINVLCKVFWIDKCLGPRIVLLMIFSFHCNFYLQYIAQWPVNDYYITLILVFRWHRSLGKISDHMKDALCWLLLFFIYVHTLILLIKIIACLRVFFCPYELFWVLYYILIH